MTRAAPEEDGSDSAEEQLGKFMQELRVALPGVQVLLAFLLTAVVLAVAIAGLWVVLPLALRTSPRRRH